MDPVQISRLEEGHHEPKKSNLSIEEDLLMGILEAGKDSLPNEFLAMLVEKKGIICELQLIPGTVAGNSHAWLPQFMRPPDPFFKVVGTVHTHPSRSFRPSNADLNYFSRNGRLHIIAALPFSMHSWAAYDQLGQRVELPVVSSV